MEVLAVAKGLTLRCEPCATVPWRLVGDPVRLRQVLVNLIGNAIKFTEQGAVEVTLHADVRAADGVVDLRFAVRDSGIGIPEEKLKMIFEPFRQADGSTSRRYGGTRLGLAICGRLGDLRSEEHTAELQSH